jgi:hypothetical protein
MKLVAGKKSKAHRLNRCVATITDLPNSFCPVTTQ